MATKKEITTILDKIKGIYGERFTLNLDIINAWTKSFESVAIRFLEDALQAHMENSSKVPFLADIRLEALKLSGGRFTKPRSYEPDTALIDGIVEANIRSGMVYVEEEFNGKIVSRVVKSSEAIQVRKKWRMKIDVILEAFPVHEWNQELLSELDIKSISDVSYYELIKCKDWQKDYQKKRDHYAEMAKRILEDRL